MNGIRNYPNSAKLDDCYSTVFTLADLKGIKWNKFSSSSNSLTDDPVLLAYSKCLECDILAVWRQKNKKCSKPGAKLQIHQEKEIYIFWWGDEPVVEEIRENRCWKDQACGNFDEGLSYDCRTLFYKAVHNLIERCLLIEGHVRINRWFTKPFSHDADDISDQFSFSLSFFLHGESKVCATVEVAKHQNVCRLTSELLEQITTSPSTANSEVILSPYGLKARLTGIVYREVDSAAKKLLCEWKPFYPFYSDPYLQEDFNQHFLTGVPPVVEVIHCGIRMNYPSSYILVPCDKSLTDNFNSSDAFNEDLMIDLPATSKTTPSRVDVNKQCEISENECVLENQINITKDRSLELSQLSTYKNIQINNSESWGGCTKPVAINRSSNNAYMDTLLKSFTNHRQIRFESLDSPSDSSFNSFNKISTLPQEGALSSSSNLMEMISEFSSNEMTRADQDPPPPPPPPESFNFNSSSLSSSNFFRSSTVEDFNPILPLSVSSFNSLTPWRINNELSSPDGAIQLPSNPKKINDVSDFLIEHPRKVRIASCDCYVIITKLLDQLDKWKTYMIRSSTKRPLIDEMMSDSVFGAPVDSPEEDYSQYGDILVNYNKTLDIYEKYGLCKRRKLWKVEPHLMLENSKSPPTSTESSINPSSDFTSTDSTSNIQSSRCFPKITTVGSGKLAGMVVAPDPYEFDDDPEDSPSYNGITNSSSRPTIDPSTTSSFTNQDPSNWTLNNRSINKSTSQSQLELLLIKGPFPNQPQLNLNSATTSIPSPSPSSITKGAQNMQFTMQDLESNLFEDTTGAPTPPTHINDHLPNQLAPRTSSSGYHQTSSTNYNIGANYSSDNIMYPTPPSQENCQPNTPPDTLHPATDPVSRSILSLPRHDVINTSSASFSANPEVADCSNLEQVDEMKRCLAPSGDINAISVRGLKNFCSTVRCTKFPAPSNYSPLTFLSFNNTFNKSYVPSWKQVSSPCDYFPSSISTSVTNLFSNYDRQASLPHSYFSSPAPSTPMVATPSSRGATSVRTPSSQHQQPSPRSSPKTPMMIGSHCRSVETLESPASSFATQNSHRVPSRAPPSVDLHGNIALHLNLLISDSTLNTFHDRSFDLCTLCVCCEHGFHSFHINDDDLSTFGASDQPSDTHVDWEASSGCRCGFSTAYNKMASKDAGLFIEDELDINDLEFEDKILSSCKEDESFEYGTEVLQDLMEIVLQRSCSPFNLDYFASNSQPKDASYVPNAYLEREERTVCNHALSCSLSAVDSQQLKSDIDSSESPIHQWSQSLSDALTFGTNIDIYRLLYSLKNPLQDAIQRKKTARTFASTQHVKGPLTWRDFCKAAEKDAGSQPIPTLKTGRCGEWANVTPLSLKYWDKLYLEPYSSPHNIVYAVLIEDQQDLCTNSISFFNQFSSLYQSCRLGRLWPLTKDGLVRVDTRKQVRTSPNPQIKDEIETFCSEVLDNKFFKNGLNSIDRISLSSYIRTCLTGLANLVKTYLKTGLNSTNESLSEPIMVRSIFESSSKNNTRSTSLILFQSLNESLDLSEDLIHSTIAIFIIDPFQGSKSREFWRCFAKLKRMFPENIGRRLLLQIIPTERIMPMSNNYLQEAASQYIRTLAYDTYVQCQHTPPRLAITRSMTGFGPASEPLFTRPGSFMPHREQTYTPMYVLNLPRENIALTNNPKKHATSSGSNLLKDTNSSSTDVLFVFYCLSQDRKFLLASATDHCGELVETISISMAVDSRRLARSRKQRVLLRSDAIKKLWKFIVKITKQSSTKVWRIVIGRLGRISHAELRDWAPIINRKSLLNCRKNPEKCQQCVVNGTSENYVIASACVTSVAPDSTLMVMSDVVHANMLGRSHTIQAQQLHTPSDISSTSLCVIATSAITQLTSQFPGSIFISNLHSLKSTSSSADGPLFDDIPLEFHSEVEGFLSNVMPENQENSSYLDNELLPGNSTERLLSHDVDQSDDKLLEQPLAIGYMVSTAPCGLLPDWFWSSCRTTRNHSPVLFKHALHIRTSVVEGSSFSHLAQKQHPLDSNNTVVLLKYVLESYNMLSWLACDLVTNDRQTCLPLHCLTLLQLYHTFRKLYPNST